MQLTERRERVYGTLTERRARVIGTLTERRERVFGGIPPVVPILGACSQLQQQETSKADLIEWVRPLARIR